MRDGRVLWCRGPTRRVNFDRDTCPFLKGPSFTRIGRVWIWTWRLGNYDDTEGSEAQIRGFHSQGDGSRWVQESVLTDRCWTRHGTEGSRNGTTTSRDSTIFDFGDFGLLRHPESVRLEGDYNTTYKRRSTLFCDVPHRFLNGLGSKI